MPEGVQYEDHKSQAEAPYKAFEREFERFARFRDGGGLDNLTLSEAEAVLLDLRSLRTRHTGKKSGLAAVKKMIGRVAQQERAALGQYVQQLEAEISRALDQAESTLTDFIAATRTTRERIDVTLPGRRPRRGHLHPITLLRQRIEDVFVSLGYAIEDDREIETDFYNFTALNIPPDHPACAWTDVV
jgi:phenylalanyl-tRNA synthetase alpha chain